MSMMVSVYLSILFLFLLMCYFCVCDAQLMYARDTSISDKISRNLSIKEFSQRVLTPAEDVPDMNGPRSLPPSSRLVQDDMHVMDRRRYFYLAAGIRSWCEPCREPYASLEHMPLFPLDYATPQGSQAALQEAAEKHFSNYVPEPMKALLPNAEECARRCFADVFTSASPDQTKAVSVLSYQ